jgi:hypothetical protein
VWTKGQKKDIAGTERKTEKNITLGMTGQSVLQISLLF